MWEQRARFCPLCGGALERRTVEGRERPACTACSLILYQNPAPAAAALVLQGDQVLLTRRDIAPFRGSWTLPAGYEEADEPPVETAVRETREETGLEVRPIGLYEVFHTRDDPRKPAILIVYLCEPVGGRLEAGDDASEARYFPVDRLPEDVGFENNRRVLARLARELARGALVFVPIESSDLPGSGTAGAVAD